MEELVSYERPKVLYHYTTVEAMYNIMLSGKLRLYNTHQMNDLTDMRWTILLVGEDLKRRNAEGKPVMDWFWDELRGISYPLYAFSLSESPDLLAQWIHYADQGRGVAMGFNIEQCKLESVLPQLVYGTKHENRSLSLLKMNYDEASLREKLKKIIDAVEKYSSIDAYQEVFPGPAHWIRNLGMIAKHPGFADEKEWRILSNNLLTAGIPDGKGPFYHVRNHQLREYREMEIKKWFPQNFLKEVFLGPACQLGEDVLRRFAYAQCGIRVLDVEKSSIPYIIK